MENFFKDVWQMIVESNVLNLVWAILVLLVGWIVAVLLSGQIAALVTRIGLDKKLNRCLPHGSELKEASASRFIGRFVYYLILLIAILGCLAAMNLTQAAEPIKEFVGSLTGYAAKILGAVALAFIAWIVATVLRYGANTIMSVVNLDDRFAKYIDNKKEAPFSETISSILYWVVLLFFLPSILNVLEIKGITEPIQQMFTKILGYIPNLIAAAAILFVGLIAAKIVRKAVTGLIIISSIDTLGDKVGIPKLFGNKGLSSMIGIVAYVLVAIPVVISSLTALKIDSLSNSVASFFDKLLNATGDILGAALLIFVAFLAGSFIAGLVTQIFENFGFNHMIAKLGFASKDEEKESTLPSVIVGKLTFLTIIFMSAIAAADILEFDQLSNLLRTFMQFGGNIIIGVIVLLIGIWISNFAAESVKGKCNDLVVLVIRVAVLIFTGAIAIHNMNIGGPIVQTAFSLLLGAVCVAIALAFGLGGREAAAKKLAEWTGKMDKKD